ncbi:MAG: xanthine dehydrogenase family protein molybdopterin-binding subunit [Pseudomonadota bacterium]|nr:xanthine dehydrogenase family protein molybdopterin-binding subunit [Pseudomonadota bacterium]MEE2859680.1 xanthine dehydrogenase family protein molybdopterin-binding subunit [Pseudomonadota bacterium]
MTTTTGKPAKRVEDERFIRGQGCYTDDMTFPGQLHAVFVRSQLAHARIGGIDISAARDMPGVHAVLTGDDLVADGVGHIELDIELRHPGGDTMVKKLRRPLATEKVAYVGEPVAIVVADTVWQAKDAAEAVMVDYDPLDAVVGARQALEQNAPEVWDEAPGNLSFEFHYGKPDAVADLFAGAAHITTARLKNQRLTAAPIEPRAAIGLYDPAYRHFTLYCSHQTPHPMRTHTATTLGVPEHRVRIIARDVGGGFGGKGPTYPEELAVLAAARATGRPVRWVCERSEAFLSDAHARDHDTNVEMALDAEGTILAVRIEDVADLGAYVSSFGAGPPVLGQSGLTVGTYRIQAVSGTVRLAYTNTMPTDAYRGAGRPEICYMIERTLDIAAREMGLSPVELRRRNLIQPDQMPYASPTGRLYDSGDFPKAFERALELADYAGLEHRKEAARKSGRRRGFGVVCYIDNTGMGPSARLLTIGSTFGTYEGIDLRVSPDGSSVVSTATHTHGQGHETVFAQIVADRLGVEIGEVQLKHGDTEDLAYGRGTVGSRSLQAAGSALSLALDRTIEKGKLIAAAELACDPDELDFEEGLFRRRDTNETLSFRDVARLAYFPSKLPDAGLEPGLGGTAYWDPAGLSFPNGCHICEVDIVEGTGEVEIVNYVAVDDFGNVINPMIVAGQVHGGVAQGISQALWEEVAYDGMDGQLISGSFMDYTMPRSDSLPSYRLASSPTATQTNLLGVKGCGEAGTVAATPTAMNAVMDALAPLGILNLEMPATPARVWDAIETHRAS